MYPLTAALEAYFPVFGLCGSVGVKNSTVHCQDRVTNFRKFTAYSKSRMTWGKMLFLSHLTWRKNPKWLFPPESHQKSCLSSKVQEKQVSFVKIVSNQPLSEEHIIFFCSHLRTFISVSKAYDKWLQSADLPVIGHQVAGEPALLLGAGDFQLYWRNSGTLLCLGSDSETVAAPTCFWRIF